MISFSDMKMLINSLRKLGELTRLQSQLDAIEVRLTELEAKAKAGVQTRRLFSKLKRLLRRTRPSAFPPPSYDLNEILSRRIKRKRMAEKAESITHRAQPSMRSQRAAP